MAIKKTLINDKMNKTKNAYLDITATILAYTWNFQNFP